MTTLEEVFIQVGMNADRLMNPNSSQAAEN